MDFDAATKLQLIANAENETNLSDPIRDEMLRILNSSSDTLEDEFLAVCEANYLTGRPATIPGGDSARLHRVVDSELIVERIAALENRSYGPQYHDDVVRRLNDLDIKKSEIFLGGKAGPGKPERPVWACFFENESQNFLTLKRTAGHVRDAMGLNYGAPNQGFICFTYDAGMLEQGNTLRVPTVADARDFAQFRPSAAGAPFGKSLPITLSPDEYMPEITHRNRDAGIANLDYISN